MTYTETQNNFRVHIVTTIHLYKKVKQIADQKDSKPDDPYESGNEARLENLPQNDHLRKGQGDHRHHEGQDRTQSGTLFEQGMHHGDDARRVGIHGNTDQYGYRHRPPGRFSHETGHDPFGYISMNTGANRDTEHDIYPDLANDVVHGFKAIANPIRRLHQDSGWTADPLSRQSNNLYFQLLSFLGSFGPGKFIYVSSYNDTLTLKKFTCR